MIMIVKLDIPDTLINSIRSEIKEYPDQEDRIIEDSLNIFMGEGSIDETLIDEFKKLIKMKK